MKSSPHTVLIDAHNEPDTLVNIFRILADESCPVRRVQMSVKRDVAFALFTIRFETDAFTLDAVLRKLRRLIDVRSATIAPFAQASAEALA